MVEPVPAWITIFAASACGGLLLIVAMALAGILYTVKRRNADARREIAELEEQNVRLRRELERVRSGQDAAGSTDIREL